MKNIHHKQPGRILFNPIQKALFSNSPFLWSVCLWAFKELNCKNGPGVKDSAQTVQWAVIKGLVLVLVAEALVINWVWWVRHGSEKRGRIVGQGWCPFIQPCFLSGELSVSITGLWCSHSVCWILGARIWDISNKLMKYCTRHNIRITLSKFICRREKFVQLCWFALK